MLRYYVFFYLFCVSVTLYIGYRDIVLLDDEPPAEIEGRRREDDARGQRSRRDVGDSRTLGFDLLMEKLVELRRVSAALKLQKLQQHNPERFRQKTEKTKKKMKPDEKTVKGQSSTNSGDQSRSSKSEESDGYPGSSQGKEDSGRRGGKSRKKRQIIDNLKGQINTGVKYLQSSGETNMGGVYLQNPNDYFDEEKQILEDNQVQEGVAKSMFVDHYVRTLMIFLGLQALIAVVVIFAMWAQAYIRYDIWHFQQGDLYEMYRDFFQDWDKDAGIGETDKTAALNDKMLDQSDKVEEKMMRREDWIEKMQQKRDETAQLRQYAKAQAERNQAARERIEDLEAMQENLEKQAKRLAKQKKKAEKKKKGKG